MEGIRLEGLVLFAWKGCFHVSGERSVPAGGAGECPEVLLDGEDHHEGDGGGRKWSGNLGTFMKRF